MRRFTWLLFPAVSLFIGSLVFAAACRGRQPEPQQPEYTTTATVKDLMDSLVDPSADVVWDAVATESGANGIVDRTPKNDEEWKTVRHGAIRLVEASNLLLIPGRHVAQPGEKSEAPGIELVGEEMEVLINKDRAAWNRRAKGLHEAAVEALQAIDAKDAPKLFEIGGHIENACESCHSQYWYPNQQLPPGYGPSSTQ